MRYLYACFIICLLNPDSTTLVLGSEAQKLKKELMGKAISFGKECMVETNTSFTDVTNVMLNKPNISHGAKCLLHCVQKRFNLFNDAGAFDQNVAIQMIAPLKNESPDLYEKTIQILNSCTSKVEANDDVCIYAYEWTKCGYTTAKEMHIKIPFLKS